MSNNAGHPRAPVQATHPNAGIAANTDIKTVGGVKIQSYADCVEFMDTSVEKKLGSNVRVRAESFDPLGISKTVFAVVLYKTPIITYYPDETFSVDNGGFNTPTTSRRVTQFTPEGYTFHHENKRLVLSYPGEPTEGVRFPVERNA